MLPTRALLAACLLAPLPVVLQGTAHAAAYCSIPDTPALTAQESGPREGYLAGSGSDAFVDWVYPSPRPAAKEPTAA
ncbi:hypothetical protein ACIBK9_10305 [Nonomuraea sp. NPDC050227]